MEISPKPEYSEAMSLLQLAKNEILATRDVQRALNYALELEDLHPFAQGKGSWVNLGGMGGAPYQGALVAIFRLLAGASVSEVLSEAINVLAQNSAPMLHVVKLDGISCDEEVDFEICNGLRFTNVNRHSNDPRTQSYPHSQLTQFGFNDLLSQQASYPDMMLVSSFELKPLLYSGSSALLEVASRPNEKSIQVAIDALTLSGNSPVFPGTQKVVPEISSFPSMSSVSSAPVTRRARVTGSIPNLEDVHRTFNLLQASTMASPQWLAFRLAVQRVSRSRILEAEEADRALDLGLALEMLTTFKDDAKGEISFRVATRAALLIGGSSADKVSYFSTAKKLYDFRSKAAHTGQTSPEFTAFRPYADAMVCKVALSIAERNGFPNWRDLQLGAEASHH